MPLHIQLTCGGSPEVEVLLASRVRGAGLGGSTPFTFGPEVGKVSVTDLVRTGDWDVGVGGILGRVGVVGVGVADDVDPNLTEELTSGEEIVDKYPGLPGDALLENKTPISHMLLLFLFHTCCNLNKNLPEARPICHVAVCIIEASIRFGYTKHMRTLFSW